MTLDLIANAAGIAAAATMGAAVVGLFASGVVAHMASKIDKPALKKLERSPDCKPLYIYPGYNLYVAARLVWAAFTGFKGTTLSQSDRTAMALAVGLSPSAAQESSHV